MKKKRVSYLVAFIIPILILLVSYMIIGVYPFGNKSILISDMNGQYVEFYAKFYDIFKSFSLKEIIYSWDAGMGDSFLTLMMYYLISPLSFVILLLPKKYLPESLLIMQLLKIGLCGMSFNYLLSYLDRNENVPDILRLLFSTLYALIGFNIVYSFNIMWLDGVYLLPLVIVGVEEIISEKKWVLFYITILACFITNFYISYMIGIYSFLYFIIKYLLNYSVKDFKVLFKRFKLFTLATILAAGTTAIFLVPTALEILSNTGESSKLNYNINAILFQATQIGSKLFTGSYTTVKYGSPQIYSGVIVIPLVILYFFNNKIRKKAKILYGSLLLFLGLSFIDPFLNLMWHAIDAPNWFPHRFSFLFSFTILLLAYQGLKNLYTYNKKLNLFFGATIVCVFLQSIVVLLSKRMISYSIVVSNSGLCLTFIFLLVYLFLIKIFSQNNKYSIYIMYVIVLLELVVNCTLTLKDLNTELGYINRSEYEVSQNIDLLNSISYNTDDFYRIDNQLERTNNESLRLGYSGISYFSSMANINLHELLYNLGLNKSVGGLAISSEGSTSFTDSIFNIQYRISSEGVVENNNVLPLAFPVSRDILLYKSISNNAIENQNYLFKLMLQQSDENEELFLSVPFVINQIHNLSHENNSYKKINIDEDSYLDLILENKNRGSLYIKIDFENSATVNIITTSNTIVEYGRDDLSSIACIEEESNEVEHIRLEMNDEITQIKEIKIYSLNQEVFDNQIESLKQRIPSNIIVKSNKVVVKGDFQENEVLFTSIPFEKGWRAKIDGEFVPVKSIENALVLLDVPVGEHEIELYYLPYGFLTGCIISTISIFIFVALQYYTHKNTLRTKI